MKLLKGTENEMLAAKGYIYHHSSLYRGYISRKGKNLSYAKYNRRFGKGIIVFKPNYNSTRYSWKVYYIKA